MTSKRKAKKIRHINTKYLNSSYHTNHLFVIMSELVNYIHEFGTALKEENPSDFIKCITISPTITIANTVKSSQNQMMLICFIFQKSLDRF